MALNNVELPYKYYPDPAQGRPVFNGSIFVGEPDLDPTILANQKQIAVIQEDGTRVDVSQPVNTSAGGVAVFNGSPVSISVSGDYSLAVLNNKGAQVYFAASAADFSDPTINPSNFTEGQTLSDGQTVVVFSNDIDDGQFFIVGDLADNGRLNPDVDYTFVTSTKTVTLTQSYPAGTVLMLGFLESIGASLTDATFSTVALMKAASIEVGEAVSTKGYYDGWAASLVPNGAGLYNITTLTAVRDTRSEPTWVPDELVHHTIANGNIAMLENVGYLDAYKGGVVFDNLADDTSALQACLNAFTSVLLPVGNGRVSTLTMNSGQSIKGHGRGNSILQKIPNTTGHVLFSAFASNLADIYLDGFEIFGNRATHTIAAFTDGIHIEGDSGITNSFSVIANDVEVHAMAGDGWHIGPNRDRPTLTYCYGYDVGHITEDNIANDKGHAIVINSAGDAFLGDACGFGSAANRSIFIKTSATPVISNAEVWWADNVAGIHIFECPSFMITGCNLDRARQVAIKISGRVGGGFNTPDGMHENGFILGNTFLTPRGTGGAGVDGDVNFIELEKTTGPVINSNNFSVDPFNSLDVKVDFIVKITGALVSDIAFNGNNWSTDANYIPYVTDITNDRSVYNSFSFGSTINALTATSPAGPAITMNRDSSGKVALFHRSGLEVGDFTVSTTRPTFGGANGATTVFPGPHADDAAAAVDNVQIGEAYRLTATNAVVVRAV
jgi:hypothetical protein